MNVALQTRPPVLSDYYSETKCIWCDGCGNYGIWTAVKYALVELNLHPWQVCLLLRCRLSRQRLGQN
jgi:2-oxoglutarate ferredoxin oxidoreductase subunit beta